jgi:exodeoxyribonuclease (lambda-induced)
MTDAVRQRSGDWFQARIGNLTASGMNRVSRKKDGSWSAESITYAHELAAERMTNQPTPHYESPEMRWGTEHEPDALSALGALLGSPAWSTGYTPHQTIARFGASPDGLWCGMPVEVKCPKSSTFIAYASAATLPDNYLTQVAVQMSCFPDAKEHIFAAYDPRMPDKRRLFVVRTPREELAPAIASVETLAREFLGYVDQLVAKFDAAATWPARA